MTSLHVMKPRRLSPYHAEISNHIGDCIYVVTMPDFTLLYTWLHACTNESS